MTLLLDSGYSRLWIPVVIVFGMIVGAIVLLAAYFYEQNSLYRECIKLQKYTPETEAAYIECMEQYGLNPDDWS